MPSGMRFRITVSAANYHNASFVEDDGTEEVIMEPGEFREVSLRLNPK